MLRVLLLSLLLSGCLTRPSPTLTSGGPAIFFTDAVAGPTTGGPDDLGLPIAIYGRGFGAQRGNSSVTIGGVEVAKYWSWGERNAQNNLLDMIVVQPGVKVTGGPIVVTVNGKSSNAQHTFSATGGKVYFVALSGSDSAPCSQSQPCATILHAATKAMQPGDALLVRGGSLNDDEIWIRESLGHSGQAGKPKVIRNYPGEQPRFDKVSRPVILDANHLTWSGFEFPQGKALVVGNNNSQNIRAVSNSFSGAITWDAIGTHGNNIVLAGNVCKVSGSLVGTQGHCYYISHGQNIQLLYNVAQGAPGYGIHIFDQRRSDPDITRLIANVLVEGNLLIGSPERSGMIVAMEDEGKLGNHIDGVKVRNNLFVGNNFAGIAVGGVVKNLAIEHNTFYGNGRQGITVYDDARISNVKIANNLIEQASNTTCKNNCSWYELAHIQVGAKAQQVQLSHNFLAPGPALLLGASDPQASTGTAGFANPGAFDFSLKPDSAALGKGQASDVNRDFDGQPRPSSPDPGAFER